MRFATVFAASLILAIVCAIESGASNFGLIDSATAKSTLKQLPWQGKFGVFTVELSDQQRAIYRDAYFETTAFRLYGLNVGSEILNEFVSCVQETRSNPALWEPLSWQFGQDMEMSAAWVMYNSNSPHVCSKFADTGVAEEPRLLQLYSYDDWIKWSMADRRAYVMGYLDTITTMQMRMIDMGYASDGHEIIKEIDENLGVGWLLGNSSEIEFDKSFPLPWTISRVLGNAQERLAEGPMTAESDRSSDRHGVIEIAVPTGNIAVYNKEKSLFGLICKSGFVGSLADIPGIEVKDVLSVTNYSIPVNVIYATTYYRDITIDNEVFARAGDTVCIAAENDENLPYEDDCDARWALIKPCVIVR